MFKESLIYIPFKGNYIIRYQLIKLINNIIYLFETIRNMIDINYEIAEITYLKDISNKKSIIEKGNLNDIHNYIVKKDNIRNKLIALILNYELLDNENRLKYCFKNNLKIYDNNKSNKINNILNLNNIIYDNDDNILIKIMHKGQIHKKIYKLKDKKYDHLHDIVDEIVNQK